MNESWKYKTSLQQPLNFHNLCPIYGLNQQIMKNGVQTKQFFFSTIKFVYFRVNEKSATNLKFELTEAVNQDYFWLK